MTLSLRPLLLALALSSAGAAQAPQVLPPPPAAFADADAEIDGLQERLNALRLKAEPVLGDLAALAPRYHDPAGFAAASRERVPLREGLKPLLDELAAGEQRFNQLREQVQVQKVLAGLQTVLKAGGVPQAAGAEFVRSNTRLAFAQEIQQFQAKAVAALHLDEEAFRAAEARAELEKRRGLEVWAVGGGAALLLALVALLIENARLRRALRPQSRSALPPPT